MPDFTVEELNLMCVFDCTDRTAIVDGIRDSLPYVYEPEMKAIMQTVISKVEQMTHEQFSQVVFVPADEFDDMEV